MQIFDLHADLACAIHPYAEKHEISALKDHWESRLNKGEIRWTAAASFFAGSQDWSEMQNTVLMVKNDILNSGSERILKREDLDENQKTVRYLMTIEGMCGIDDEPEQRIDWLYDQGNRIGSLCWNDENALATGNSGNPARGLTDLGVRAVKEMNRKHFIIDVSHANEKTFWDLLDASELPVIATHSNAKTLCCVERNLTDQQIRALAQKGGIIGMNACASFISKEKSEQNAAHLAKHARYIADLVGVEHVAVGFDLGAYYDNTDSHDLHEPENGQNFIRGLQEAGFTDEEIRDIAYRNVFRFLQKYM